MRPLLSFAAVVAIVMLVGCVGPEKPGVMQAPAFTVPTSGMAHVNADPYQLLPASDGDVYIPRMEKFAYGTSNSSATIYTYDTENISIRHSGTTGYRYRWIVQELN